VSLLTDAARAILQARLTRLTDAHARLRGGAVTTVALFGAAALGVAGAISYGRLTARMRTDNLLLRGELASLERRLMEYEQRLAELERDRAI
jgi:hypothetical protein